MVTRLGRFPEPGRCSGNAARFQPLPSNSDPCNLWNIDIMGVGRWQGQAPIVADGAMIRQLRVYLDRSSGRLRLVLDLAPGVDYAADPVYYRENDLFCLTVRREKR